MRLETIPLLTLIRDRLGYLGERQRLVAENVANSDTPGFVPRDLKPQQFESGAGLATSRQAAGAMSASRGLARTHSGHMAAGGAAVDPRFSPQRMKDSETTLDGNSVVLEEQMLKMAETRMAFDAAIGFYQKSLNMIRMASRRPGQ